MEDISSFFGVFSASINFSTSFSISPSSSSSELTLSDGGGGGGDFSFLGGFFLSRASMENVICLIILFFLIVSSITSLNVLILLIRLRFGTDGFVVGSFLIESRSSAIGPKLIFPV